MVQLILEEFSRLKSTTIGEEEIQRAKDYMKGNLLLSLESTMSRMSNLARQEMYFGRHISLDEIAERVTAVKAEEVREVARDLFRPDQIGLTVLGPLPRMEIGRSDLEC